MAILNLNEFVSKKKLSVWPETIFKLLYLYQKLPQRMIQQEAKKHIFEPGDCYFCSRLRKKYSVIAGVNPRQLLCRKHRSIYDFSHYKQNTALLRLNNDYLLFTEYALTPMKTDPNGYYVVHLAIDKFTSFKSFFVFALSKNYFPDAKHKADITDKVLSYDIVTLYKHNKLWAIKKQDRTNTYELAEL